MLTPREKEVLSRREEGLSNKQVAAALGLSIYTVKQHVRKILRKTTSHSILEALHKLRQPAA